MTASKRGNIEEAKSFLNSGSNINEKDKHGYTPLMNAIYNKKIEMAKYLINAGADVKVKDSNGYDALILAVDLGYEGFPLIEPLIDHGADIESRDSSGWTPLMHSVTAYGGLNTARLLIKKGADLKAKEPTESKTAYEIALTYQNSSIAAELKGKTETAEATGLVSKIIFIREYSLMNAARVSEVKIGEHIVNLHNKSTNFIDIKPGICEMVSQGYFGEGDYKLSFNSEAGKTYYVEVIPRTGYIVSGMAGGMFGVFIESRAKGEKAGPFEMRMLEESVAKEKIKALE
jgi:hypothetical protein